MKQYVTQQMIENQLANLSQITFEITDNCNLQCKYCAYGELYNDYDKREKNNLSFEKATSILNYLNIYWQSKNNSSVENNIFISFYGGEPLLNMNFIIKVIDFLEQMDYPNRHFTYSMTTNAVLLNKYMDYLIEKDFHLLISLDGNRDNNLYRVDKANKPSYNAIIKNIDKLQNKYPEYFNNKVNFNSVLHNKNSVESIYKFFKDEYNKIPSISPLNNMGVKENKLNEFEKMYQDTESSLISSDYCEQIQKDIFLKSSTYQDVCSFLHQYGEFTYQNYRELLLGKHENLNWVTGTCIPFNKKLFITVNGKILPCERIGHQFSLGYINDKNEVVLNFETICSFYNNYFRKLDSQCEVCYGKKSCIQCIFNIEKIDDANPICHGFMNKKNFENYVTRNLFFLINNPEDYYKIMEEVVFE